MATSNQYRNDYSSTSPTLTDIAAGSVGAGATLLMHEVKDGTLSATCVFDAETNTLTLTPLWQVSKDASTWKSVYPDNNAITEQATGTGGADASVTHVVPAPLAVYGYRYARCTALVGVTTATSSDTATISYDYQVDLSG